MRLIPVFLCLIAIACTNQTQQPNVPVDTAKVDTTKFVNTPVGTLLTDSAIAYIRAAFQQINTMPLQQKNFKWIADNCNVDGTATYYLTNNNEIVKVVETGAIGDGSWTTAYYYKQGQFLFSLSTDIGGPAVGPVDTTITRKYVYANKVVRAMLNDTYITTEDSVLTPASKEYKILEAYKSKNFGTAFCE